MLGTGLLQLLSVLHLASPLVATITDKYVTVKDVDFRNTKVDEVCMLANFRCNITITNKNTGTYVKTMSWLRATSEGSYCDRKFVSHLRLNYNSSIMIVNFTKIDEAKEKDGSTIKPAKYCDNCNVGTWRITTIQIHINNLTQYTRGSLQYEYKMILNASEETLKNSITDLTHFGIEINRAYECEDSKYMNPIPMDIISVHNISSNYTPFIADDWVATLQFTYVSIQPFLVKDAKINDPYLCGDLTLAHCLIILVPLLYFFVMIMIYKCRATHGGCTFGKVHTVKEEIYGRDKLPLNSQEKKLLTVNYKPISSTTENTTDTANNNYAI